MPIFSLYLLLFLLISPSMTLLSLNFLFTRAFSLLYNHCSNNANSINLAEYHRLCSLSSSILQLTTMTTITVKQYVMLLTSQSIVCAAFSHNPGEISNPYKYASPIMRIVCADGEELSVQAHGGCHVKFKDVPDDGTYFLYASTFGKELIACETDCVELNQFGIDSIEDIENYVAFHGGIDIEATTSKAIERAIKACERYIQQK